MMASLSRAGKTGRSALLVPAEGTHTEHLTAGRQSPDPSKLRS